VNVNPLQNNKPKVDKEHIAKAVSNIVIDYNSKEKNKTVIALKCLEKNLTTAQDRVCKAYFK